MASTFKFKTLYHDKAVEIPGATHYIANEIAVEVYNAPKALSSSKIAMLIPGTAVRVTKENIFHATGTFYEFVVPTPNVPGELASVFLNGDVRFYAKDIFFLPLDSINIHPSVEVKREMMTPLERASMPEWYESLNPYYNSEELEYYIPTTLPHECIIDSNDLESQKNEARFRGIKKLLKYHNLSDNPLTWPPVNLFNGFLTSYVDAVYIDPRPGSKVKMLVKIPAQYFNWYLGSPELGIQDNCSDPLEDALAAASRIINIPIDEIDKRVGQIQKILSRYEKQMKKASVYIPGLNLSKEADRIMKTMNNFKQLLVDNKHHIPNGIKDVTRTLSVGLDINDSIIWARANYGEHGSFPLSSGFKNLFNPGGSQLTNVILSESENMISKDAYGSAPEWTDWLESGSSRVLKKATGSFKLSDVVSEIDLGDIDYNNFEIPPLEPGDWPSFDSIDPLDFNIDPDKFQSWSGLPPFKSFSMIMGERNFLDNPDFKLDFARARDLAKDLGIDSIDDAFIKEIMDKLPSSLLSNNPIAKIHDLILNRISLFELMAWARNNLEDIDVKGLLKEQLEKSAGICVEETEAQACAHDPLSLEDLKELAPTIPPPGDISWPSFDIQLETYDMLGQMIETMKFMIEKAIAAALIAAISSMLKTVADAIETAPGQDPLQMKDYGETNLADAIREAYDTEAQLKQSFVECGIPEWMPVDRCMGFMDIMSSQLTSRELMNFLAGIPSMETMIIVRDIIEFDFPEFEPYLTSPEQIEDFGSCLGDKIGSQIAPVVDALNASVPSEIDICDIDEAIEDKCGDEELAEALTETAKTKDIEKFKTIEETLRDPECMKALVPTILSVPANVDAFACVTPSKKGLMSFFEVTGISDIFDDLTSSIFNTVINELIEEGQKATRRLSEKNPAAPRSISALAANPSGDVIFDNAPKPASMVPAGGGDFYPIIKNGLQTSLYGLSETISYDPSSKFYYIGENNQIGFTFPILPGVNLLDDAFGVVFGPGVGIPTITVSKKINPELQEAMDTGLDFISLEADNTKPSQLTVLEQLVGNNLGAAFVDLSPLYPLMIQNTLAHISQEVGFSNLFNKWDFKKTGNKWTDFIKDSSGNDLIDEFTHAPGDSGDNRMPRDIYGNTVNYFKPPLYLDLIDVAGEKPKVKKIDLSAYGFGEEQQPPRKGIIDIQTAKDLAKENWDWSEPYNPNGLSSFQKATLQGIIHLIIQIYSVEAMLRSIFVDSKFDNSKSVDQLMVEVVYNTLNSELSNSNALYYGTFQEQVVEAIKDRFAKGELKEDGKLITVASTMYASAKAKAAAGPPPMPDPEDKYLLAGTVPAGMKDLPPFEQYDVNEDGVLSVKDSDAAAQAGNQELANNIGALIIAIKGKLKETVTVSAGYTTEKSIEEQEYDQQAALNEVGLQGGFYTDAAAGYEEGYTAAKQKEEEEKAEEEYNQQAVLGALGGMVGGDDIAALAEEGAAEQAAAAKKPKKIKKYKKVKKDTKVTKEEYEAYIKQFEEIHSAKAAEEEALYVKALEEAEKQIAAKQAAGEAAVAQYEEGVAKLEEAIAAANEAADWPDFTYGLSLRLLIKEALQGNFEKQRMGIKEKIKLKLIEAQNQQANTSNAPVLFENNDVFSAGIWQFGNEALDVQTLVDDITEISSFPFYYDNTDVDFGKYNFFKKGGFVIEKYWIVDDIDSNELSKRTLKHKGIISEKDFLTFLGTLGFPETSNLNSYEDALSYYAVSENDNIADLFANIRVGKRLSYVFLQPSDDQPELQEFVQNNPEVFLSNATEFTKSGVFYENTEDSETPLPVYTLPIIPLGEVDVTEKIAQAGWTLEDFKLGGKLSMHHLNPGQYLENGGFFIDNDPEAPVFSTISMGTNSIPGLNPAEIKESAEFKLITQYSIPTQRLMDVVSIYCMNRLSGIEMFKKTKKEAKRAFLITLKATDEINLKKKITLSPMPLPSQIFPELLDC